MENNKVVLLTGASSGIGKKTAISLINDGFKVYCVARNIQKMEDLKALGGIVYQMDVTDPENINVVVNSIIAKEQKIDILINNAGFGLFGPIEDISLDEAHRQFDTNVMGTAAVIKAVVPHMRTQKNGLIINMSSMGGRMYTPLGGWYHASKYAVEGFSDCLRVELQQFGIKVVIVEPGLINTPFYTISTDELDSFTKSPYAEMINNVNHKTKNLHNSKNMSDPQVIADLILKICHKKNPKPRYVKGKYGKLFILGRQLLGDRLFDKISLQQIKH